MTKEEVKERFLDIICDIYEQNLISDFGYSLKNLCNSLEINLIPYSSFGNDIDKFIKFEEDGFSLLNSVNRKCEIYYNDKIYPKRRIKFTIPHELGHILLGHPLYSHEETKTEKWQADLFANELYCPQAFMIHYKLLTSSDLVSNFGITWRYAETLLDKLNERGDKRLTTNEKRLIEIFEKNKLLKNRVERK